MNQRNNSFLSCALITIMALLFFSCSKDNEEVSIAPIDAVEQNTQQETKDNNARYYVKYEVEASTAHRVSFTYNISYTKDSGVGNVQERLYSSDFSWNDTYGPFKKGDKVSLSCSLSTPMDITASIHVCRNDEPFAAKAEYKKMERDVL